MEEQLRVKDSQLEKQAVHIQTLINQKAIEAPGAKKPWWRFFKGIERRDPRVLLSGGW